MAHCEQDPEIIMTLVQAVTELFSCKFPEVFSLPLPQEAAVQVGENRMESCEVLDSLDNWQGHSTSSSSSAGAQLRQEGVGHSGKGGRSEERKG